MSRVSDFFFTVTIIGFCAIVALSGVKYLVDTSLSEKLERDAIHRGYGVICFDRSFAWKGECNDDP